MPATQAESDHGGIAATGLAALVPAIHPARIAACLDGSLSPTTLARLQASGRLHERLARLVLGDAPEISTASSAADPLLGAAPRRVALLAGAVWHARSLLKLIAGQDIAIFTERVGAEVHAFGIRHVEQAVSSTLITGPERLAEAVEHDGHGCLGAWLAALPEPDRRQILLRLPPGTVAEQSMAVHAAAAGEIFAAVLPHLASVGTRP
ncbi:nodulation protein NolU (plasmid) [Bosea vestrisii]|uniref:nodulation protein NolU n=1 Tax=Bosea vestrisii TaxID=151416 RepID=UPI0024DF703A|nr:nodulation protein NolU [Bosea vestrisii]WID99708.1 nodulation protein NolU [Bosea vestrisii]